MSSTRLTVDLRLTVDNHSTPGGGIEQIRKALEDGLRHHHPEVVSAVVIDRTNDVVGAPVHVNAIDGHS